MAREGGRGDDPVRAGVIGVGSMGKHHARVYNQLPHVDLVGVVDDDEERAAEVAGKHLTTTTDIDSLLDEVDAVSVAVPTEYHFDIASRCIDAGLAVLVEKPFVPTLEEGRELISRAERAGVTLQIGHIERFNPAVSTLGDVFADIEPLAVDVNRLGPPRDRHIGESAVIDLMIHDIDIVLSLFEGTPDRVVAAGIEGNEYATAILEFEGALVTLTASRLTQRKVRAIDVTARSCLVEADLMDRSVEIHRHSSSGFVEGNDGVSYRHESVVERPFVSNGEPLVHELETFLDAVETGEEPVVSGEDGLRALELAQEIERRTEAGRQVEAEVSLD